MMKPSESGLVREQELFQRCLETDPADRAALLDLECSEDVELRARIERLIEFHQEPGDNNSFLALDGRDPDRIGPYRILQRLGEGGMGIVYAAEQREPVRRRVAIKVLRSGYSSREVLARFDVERQALALMSHNNIARILDAGTTPDHRPYIVMEYVPGETITHYCQQHDLSLVERLQMFIDVCDAVQHAHQRGIIHRDLKPSNILVREEDGKPVVKVIDFGIAKAIAQRLTDQTLETKVGSLLGTPDYMSPEQAELSPLDVDTRADIYALGAVLYQVLTGVTPLQLAGSGSSFAEIQQQINERVPAPPSHRANGLLQKALRGELDWITCKALEKQRQHRYSSAAEFANDIRAYLDDRTVSAGPPSRTRAIRKFLRRHWLGTVAVASIALVLAVSQVLLVQKNRELELERDRANYQARVAREVSDFTTSLLRLSTPYESGQSQLSAHELVELAVERLEQSSRNETPEARAGIYRAAGSVYTGLGKLPEAVELLEAAVELQRQLQDVDERELGEALSGLAYTERTLGNIAKAESRSREAIEILRDSGHDNFLFRARINLAESLAANGALEAAAQEMSAAIEAAEDNKVQDENIVYALARLARYLVYSGELMEADSKLHLAEQLVDKNWQGLRLYVQLSRGEWLLASGEQELAVAELSGARDAVAETYGEDHLQLADAMLLLAMAQIEAGAAAGPVEASIRSVLDILRRNGMLETPLGLAARTLDARVLVRQGRYEEAHGIFVAVATRARDLLGPAHPLTIRAMHDDIVLQAQSAAPSTALDAAGELLRLAERASIREQGLAAHAMGLALLANGREPEGSKQLARAAELLAKAHGEHSPPALMARRSIADALKKKSANVT